MDKHGLPSVEKKSRSKWSNRIAIICGCLAPVFFPPIHIGILYYFWEDFSRSVDKHFCSCSCWDTVFKGEFIIIVGLLNEHFPVRNISIRRVTSAFIIAILYISRDLRNRSRSIQASVLQCYNKYV